jgi:hypothetical protein
VKSTITNKLYKLRGPIRHIMFLITICLPLCNSEALVCGNKGYGFKKELDGYETVFTAIVEKDGEGRKLIVQKEFRAKVPKTIKLYRPRVFDEVTSDPVSSLYVGETYLIGTNATAEKLFKAGEHGIYICELFTKAERAPEMMKWLNAGGLKKKKPQKPTPTPKPKSASKSLTK